jgi:hypothetical protein
MKMGQVTLGVLSALAIEAGATSAATTIYTDRAAFDIATGGSLNFEDFSDTTFENVTIDSDAGFVTSGFFRDRPTPTNFFQTGATTTYTFSTATTAFGGDFDLSPNGNGNGLQFVLSNGEIVSEEIAAPFDGFWGFVSDLSFTSVTVLAGSGAGRAETHNFDNFSFGLAQPVAPVPLPAGLPLLLSALFGFAGLRHWSRRKAAV